MSSLLMSVWRERVSVTSSAPSTLAVSSPRPRLSPATTPDLCFSSNSLRTNPSLYKSGPPSLSPPLSSHLSSLSPRVCLEYSLTSLLRAHSQNLFFSHSISLQLVCHYFSPSFSLHYFSLPLHQLRVMWCSSPHATVELFLELKV